MKWSRLTMLKAFLKSILSKPSLDPLCFAKVSRRECDYFDASFATNAIVFALESFTDVLLASETKTLRHQAPNGISASERSNRALRFLKRDRDTTSHQGPQKLRASATRKVVASACERAS